MTWMWELMLRCAPVIALQLVVEVPAVAMALFLGLPTLAAAFVCVMFGAGLGVLAMAYMNREFDAVVAANPLLRERLHAFFERELRNPPQPD